MFNGLANFFQYWKLIVWRYLNREKTNKIQVVFSSFFKSENIDKIILNNILVYFRLNFYSVMYTLFF
jgi:hypothetical protein